MGGFMLLCHEVSKGKDINRTVKYKDNKVYGIFMEMFFSCVFIANNVPVERETCDILAELIAWSNSKATFLMWPSHKIMA
jgi:hypothetical protein